MADRIEIQLARLSQMVSGFMGSKTKVTDFMPTFKEKAQEKVSNLASQVMSLFGGKS